MTQHPPIGEHRPTLTEQLGIQVDERSGTVIIAGVRYAAGVFNDQGLGGVIGRWMRLEDRDDKGVVTVSTVSEPFGNLIDGLLAIEKRGVSTVLGIATIVGEQGAALL